MDYVILFSIVFIGFILTVPTSVYGGECIRFSRANITDDCTDILTCKRTEICNSNTLHPNKNYGKHNLCYAAYHSDDKINFVPHLTGCNYGYFPCRQNVSQCILEKHLNLHGWYGCCCSGNLCNRNLNFTLVEIVANKSSSVEIIRKPRKKVKGKSWTLIIPVTVLSLIILIGILIFFIKRYLRKRRNQDALLQGPFVTQEPVEMHEIIHRGQFNNTVWKALYNKQLVAVKMFTCCSKAIWEVEKDIYTNCNLKHKNILKFVTAEQRQQESVTQYWIITEYADHGSLTDYLMYTVDYDFDRMLQLMLDLLRGLTYLHKEDFFNKPKKPIIAHRDLKSRNILVKHDLTLCIGDFGSAVAFHNQNYEVSNEAIVQVGTKRYMAPEILQGAVAFHVAAFLCSDSYSLALIMWELLSRCNIVQVDPYRLPYEAEVGKNPSVYDMRQKVVEKNLRPKMKKEWKEHEKLSVICNAIESCWDKDADARLSSNCFLLRLLPLVVIDGGCNNDNDDSSEKDTSEDDQLIISIDGDEKEGMHESFIP